MRGLRCDECARGFATRVVRTCKARAQFRELPRRPCVQYAAGPGTRVAHAHGTAAARPTCPPTPLLAARAVAVKAEAVRDEGATQLRRRAAERVGHVANAELLRTYIYAYMSWAHMHMYMHICICICIYVYVYVGVGARTGPEVSLVAALAALCGCCAPSPSVGRAVLRLPTPPGQAEGHGRLSEGMHCRAGQQPVRGRV